MPAAREPDWPELIHAIDAASGTPLGKYTVHGVAGSGSVGAYRLSGRQQYFIKHGNRAMHAMFEAEAVGLAELAATGVVRLPRVVCAGRYATGAYLALEYIDLAPLAGPAQARLGTALAALHRITATRYGWRRDNMIGANPQPNAPDANWAVFFRERRLRHQFDLAARNGHGTRLLDRGQRLLAGMDALLAGHQPAASLLHGDLWAGNAACDQAGRPVLYDPAVYYGDREADIAMTELFGGFTPMFQAAYRATWPLDSAYPVRRTLYNLYHVLNHLNLFGAAYQPRALVMLDELLAQLG